MSSLNIVLNEVEADIGLAGLLAEYCHYRGRDCFTRQLSPVSLYTCEDFYSIADEAFERSRETTTFAEFPTNLTAVVEEWINDSNLGTSCRSNGIRPVLWRVVKHQSGASIAGSLENFGRSIPHVVVASDRSTFQMGIESPVEEVARTYGLCVLDISDLPQPISPDLSMEQRDRTVVRWRRDYSLLAPLYVQLDRVETEIRAFGLDLEAARHDEARKAADVLLQLQQMYELTDRRL